MLTFTEITLKSCELGGTSIIPDIHDPANNPWFICDDSVPEEDRKDIGKGRPFTSLPYKTQNQYSRELKDRKHKAAILENDYLKAVFLPELGGRLWQLYDKKLGRDIVYCNDVLQTANLAFRNAWFAGGVEWNFAIPGHSPITCDKMFAQHLKSQNGQDILKLYEYESISKTIYALYATLVEDELIVRMEIENPNEKPVYMYWWTNIAIPQTNDTRVFVPANESFVTSYRDGGFRISKKETPYIDGKDISFPRNAYDAVDYFYNIPKENKKWIAGLERDGIGLLHASSDILKGRKTFIWGHLQGGKHWNNWLTGGRDYLEIQAGLLKTQFESFLMDANSKISWNESFKGIGIDPAFQSEDYTEASNMINDIAENPDAKAQAVFDGSKVIATLCHGSGRGALHELVTGKKMSTSYDFPKESLTKEEEYYTDLLIGKEQENYTISYVCDAEWAEVIRNKKTLTSLDWYLLGIIEFSTGNKEEAEKCFEHSVAAGKEYYALIALSLMASALKHDYLRAYELAKEAVALKAGDLSVAVMYGESAIRAGKYAEFIDYWMNSPEHVHNYGRIKMYAGQCYTLSNELEKAKELINHNLVVADIREGEYSVSNIWITLYKKQMAKDTARNEADITDAEVLKQYPVPYEIDFRQH